MSEQSAICLLLVEDEEPHAELVRRAFEPHADRFRIAVAGSLREARDCLSGTLPALVITDLLLPDGLGTELLSAEEEQRRFPLVVMTGHGDERAAVEALKAGALDYVVKSEAVLADMPHIVERALREWGHITERARAEEVLRQRNRELALLNRVTRAFASTLDLDQVLDAVLREVEHLLDVAACSIWLIEQETGELICLQAVGPQREIVSDWRLAPGEGIAGWVVRNGESLIVPDTRKDERHSKGVEQQVGLDLRSILSVPLRVKQEVIGVLQVVDTDVNRFHSSDLALVEPLAASASIAIENARLYQQVRDHAEQLEELVRERTAEVQAQYARLEAVLRSISDGIIVANDTGEIIQANPVVQAWLAQILSPEDAARLRETVRDMTMRVQEQPETVLELDGLDLEMEATPLLVSEAEEAVAVVAAHDISHLKALDRIKTRFVSNVSHELRTPITTIKLYAALMQKKPEKWKTYLAVLTKEADHQARLVQDILDISRMDAGRLELDFLPASLDELAEMTVANHQVLAQERGLALEHCPIVGAQPDALPVIAPVDSERILQVLNNLVGNAIRYTPEGGEVTVSTGEGKMDGRTWAMMRVADTGMGISEEELPHIFERFFRGEEPQLMQISGTGLGLAIAEEIVGLHGGRITVESQVGEGSAFTVWLPL